MTPKKHVTSHANFYRVCEWVTTTDLTKIHSFDEAAIDRVEPAPQPAAPQGDGDMLRAHAEGRVTHINNGLCPDIIEGHDTRDPECPVCQALLENHVALPAPPQGAAKGANDAASS